MGTSLHRTVGAIRYRLCHNLVHNTAHTRTVTGGDYGYHSFLLLRRHCSWLSGRSSSSWRSGSLCGFSLKSFLSCLGHLCLKFLRRLPGKQRMPLDPVAKTFHRNAFYAQFNDSRTLQQPPRLRCMADTLSFLLCVR